MCEIINLRRYKKARRETLNTARRASPKTSGGQGLVSIGIVSAELVRRLTETE